MRPSLLKQELCIVNKTHKAVLLNRWLNCWGFGFWFFLFFFMTTYSFHCRVLWEDLQGSAKTDNLLWRYAPRGKNNHLQIYTIFGTFVSKGSCFWIFPEWIKLFITKYSRNTFSAVSPAWTISKPTGSFPSLKTKNLKQSILQNKLNFSF